MNLDETWTSYCDNSDELSRRLCYFDYLLYLYLFKLQSLVIGFYSWCTARSDHSSQCLIFRVQGYIRDVTLPKFFFQLVVPLYQASTPMLKFFCMAVATCKSCSSGLKDSIHHANTALIAQTQTWPLKQPKSVLYFRVISYSQRMAIKRSEIRRKLPGDVNTSIKEDKWLVIFSVCVKWNWYSMGSSPFPMLWNSQIPISTLTKMGSDIWIVIITNLLCTLRTPTVESQRIGTLLEGIRRLPVAGI